VHKNSPENCSKPKTEGESTNNNDKNDKNEKNNEEKESNEV
jgi:hypothetical protein